MPGRVKNWFRAMKIYSYLKHRKAERERFTYDKWKLIVSLRLRPRNWGGIVHRDGRILRLTNCTENMQVWIANEEYGLHFSVEGRTYGETGNIWGHWIPWRREILKHGLRAAKCPWINREIS